MIDVEATLDHPMLRSALREVPDVTVEWERNDATEDARHLLVWVEGADVERFEAALERDPTVDGIAQSAAIGDRRLYQLVLSAEGRDRDLFPTLVRVGAVVERMTASAEGWWGHVVFPSQAAKRTFFRTCRELDVGVDLHRVRENDERDGDEVVLSEAQREALRTALESGYFEVPRRSDLAAVAAELGVSDSAASERLRRGVKAVLRQTVAPEPES